MESALVTMACVSYQYPRVRSLALHDISLDIQPGEFLGLIGPTGAGKTTLCLALNGIVPQFYGGRFFGHVRVAGFDTLEHPISVLARRVGLVFEDPETQLIATSVENEIAFALENLKVPREEIIARIPRALEAVRLEGTEKKHPHELSGGQKQRLAIAAALAIQPALLILDEPTSQLDPVGAREVFATVSELNRELGVTVLLSGHAAEELAEYADRVALLVEGALLQVDTPDAIYSDIPRLLAADLRPPQVAQSFSRMRERGVRVPHIPVRLDAGIAALERMHDPAAPPPAAPPTPRPVLGEPLLAARDLHHVYNDGTHALRGITLDIRAGEYVLIIGQNGAGKSTLVKHFLKLLEPTRGDARVGGTSTRDLSVSGLARRIGYVAQNPDSQIFNATVADEVAFALKNLKYPQAEVDARVDESLQAMGLRAARDQHPLALPRGDRARVVIAAILAMRPDVIIFDEPTTGQDYRGARYILDISRELHQMGKTVIIITHHLYLMPEYAERVLVMGKGTLLLDAPIRRAYHAIDLLRATYLTPPQAVFLARALRASDAGAGDYPLLTPDEVAACVAGQPIAWAEEQRWAR